MIKKTIGIFLLFLMLLSGVVYPLRAHAVIGLIDTGMDVPQNLKDWLMFALNIILSSLKQRLLTMITNQTISWIQGDGAPQFITDFGSVAEEAFQAAAGDTIIELGYGNLCYEPLRFKLEFQLKQQQSVFRQQVSCTLDDVVGNIAAFKENFTSGGWIAYQETLMPQNNPMGISLLTQQEFLRRKSEEESQKEYESTAGGGFLPTKRCTKWKAVEENTLVHSGDEGPPGYKYSEGEEVVVGDEDWEDTMYKKTPSGDKYTGKSERPGGGKWLCIGDQAVTPGTQVGNTVAKAFGADIDSFISADDVTEFIGGILNAAINRLTKEGVQVLGLAFSESSETGEGKCESIEDESAKAACYAAKDVKGGQKQTQKKYTDRLAEDEETADSAVLINRYSGDGTGNVPKNMDEFVDDRKTRSEEMKDNLLDDLSGFAGEENALDSASSTLYEASSTNSQTIEKLEGQEDPPGLIQCWEDKISEAEAAGESTSTIAVLEESGKEASSTLVEAEDDKNLIGEYLATIGNYEVEREAFVSRINSAYNHDVNNVTSTISEGGAFELDDLNTKVYDFLESISNLPETASQIKIRVDDRFEKVNDEIDQCTNQEF